MSRIEFQHENQQQLYEVFTTEAELQEKVSAVRSYIYQLATGSLPSEEPFADEALYALFTTPREELDGETPFIILYNHIIAEIQSEEVVTEAQDMGTGNQALGVTSERPIFEENSLLTVNEVREYIDSNGGRWFGQGELHEQYGLSYQLLKGIIYRAHPSIRPGRGRNGEIIDLFDSASILPAIEEHQSLPRADAGGRFTVGIITCKTINQLSREMKIHDSTILKLVGRIPRLSALSFRGPRTSGYPEIIAIEIIKAYKRLPQVDMTTGEYVDQKGRKWVTRNYYDKTVGNLIYKEGMLETFVVPDSEHEGEIVEVPFAKKKGRERTGKIVTLYLQSEIQTKFSERLSLPRVDRKTKVLVVDGRNYAAINYCMRQLGLSETDYEHFHKIILTAKLNDIEIPRKKVLLADGTIGITYDIEAIVTTFRQLHNLGNSNVQYTEVPTPSKTTMQNEIPESINIIMETEQERMLLQYEAELSDFYNLYYKKLFNFLYSKIGDPLLAEDILSDTYLRLMDKMLDDPNYLQKMHNIEGLLFTIANRLLIDYLRRKKLIKWESLNVDQEKDLDSSPVIFDWIYYKVASQEATFEEQTELRELIHEALATVPHFEENYPPFALYHIEGYRYAEIAKILQIKISTAKMRVMRTRDILKRYILSRHPEMEPRIETVFPTAEAEELEDDNI